MLSCSQAPYQQNQPCFDLTTFPRAQELSAASPSESDQERYLVLSECFFGCHFGTVLLVPKQGTQVEHESVEAGPEEAQE